MHLSVLSIIELFNGTSLLSGMGMCLASFGGDCVNNNFTRDENVDLPVFGCDE